MTKMMVALAFVVLIVAHSVLVVCYPMIEEVCDILQPEHQWQYPNAPTTTPSYVCQR